jgi:hypothetical protein
MFHFIVSTRLVFLFLKFGLRQGAAAWQFSVQNAVFVCSVEYGVM